MLTLNLTPIDQAVAAFKIGTPVMVFDDLTRENEADIIIAAEKITVEKMAMLIRYCSGIVCLCLSKSLCEKLDLPPMVAENTGLHKTAFTVSIDCAHLNSTGISASDRVKTVLATITDTAKPSDLARPGHIFPLCADPGGVRKRQGHTEAAIELTSLANLKPAAVICELMNDDGSVADRQTAYAFAKAHNYPVIDIASLVNYLLEMET